MQIERTYSEQFAEHGVTVDGREVATAHKVNIVWSVKHNGAFAGIAPTEAAALVALDRIAATYRAA